jgi:hypothetical protein
MKVRGMGRAAVAALMAAGVALSGGSARAMMLKPTNLVNLLQDSEVILVGTVSDVTDGIGAMELPYTEVTITVEETLRGGNAETYSFRQVGLKADRPADDSTRTMMAAPEGMPKYEIGDHVLLFMGPQATLTGLRTTVGLGEGKFEIGADRAENEYANAGLFTNVSLDAGLATPNDTRMLQSTVGAVNGDDFLSFVRRAVQNDWVSSCRMWDTDMGKQCTGGPRRPGFTTKSPSATKTYSNIQIKVQ